MKYLEEKSKISKQVSENHIQILIDEQLQEIIRFKCDEIDEKISTFNLIFKEFISELSNYKLLNNDDLNDIRYLVTDYLENRGNKKFNDISYLKNDGYEFDDIYY